MNGTRRPLSEDVADRLRQTMRDHGASDAHITEVLTRRADRMRRNVCPVHLAGLGDIDHECSGILR